MRLPVLGWQDTARALSYNPLTTTRNERWAAYRRQRRHEICQFATTAEGPPAAASDPPMHSAGQAATQLQPPSCIQALSSASSAELLQTLEDLLDLGRDDEHTTVAALQHASERLHDPTFAQSSAELNSLLSALERMLRRNLVALTPDQLGSATRAYMVLGGSSSVVISGLQACAVDWPAQELGLRALAELVWSFAWSKRPPAAAFQAHLRTAVGDPQRDWRAWCEGAGAGRMLMLLWGLASLQVMPCDPFLEAACGQLTSIPLAGLPSKSLVTLLWALARLRASDAKDSPMLAGAVEAISEELCARMEHQLSEEQLPRKQRSHQAQHAQHAARHAAAVPGQLGREQRAAAQRAQRTSGQGAEGSSGWLEASPGRAPASSSTSRAGGGSWLPQHPPASAEPPSWATPAGAAPGVATERWSDAGHAVNSEADLSPSMLATLVWAWGVLNHRSRPGLRRVTLLLQRGSRDLGPSDTTRALWGLAQLEYTPPQLLAALCSHLMQPSMLASFTARQLATTAYAFSALDHFPGEPLLGLLAERCLAVQGGLDPPSLSHVLWSLARLGYAHQPFYEQLATLVLGDIARYSPAELADVSRVYAKLGLAPEGLFEAIAEQTEASLPGADLQDVLRILTAFHQTGLQPEPLLAAVDAWANQRLRQLSPQALALALRTFAQLGGPCSPALLASAEECVEGQLERFEPGQLALVCWSFTKLGYHARGVVDQALVLLVEATPRFSDKAVSNVLWSLATLCHPLPKRAGQAPLDRVAASLQGRLKTFSAQSLATIAWSYATLGHKPASAFLQELGDVARGQLQAFEPQGLALLAWALAALGHSHQPLLSGIDEFCSSRGRLASREPQHLSNLAWGMAKVGYRPSPTFRQQLARDAALCVADMSSQEVFNVGWAFATWRLRPGQLFEALAGEAARRAFSFTSQELAGLLWALARVGHNRGAGAAALLRASEQEVDRRGSDFSDRHLAMATWAWGELGHAPGPRGMAALLREVQGRAPGLGAQELCTLLKGLVSLRAPFSQGLMTDLSACALRQAPSMKPSEAAEVLEAWLALGAQQEAAALLKRLAGTPAERRTAAAAAGARHNVAAAPSDGRPASSGNALPDIQGVAGGAAATLRVRSDDGNGDRSSSGRQPLLPRPVRAAGRAAVCLSPRPQQLSEGAAAAVSWRPESVITSSCQGPSLLDRAVDQGKPPALVRFLAAMVHLGLYPEPAFSKLCQLLSAVPPSYKFSPKDLRQLAAAAAAVDPGREHLLRLNKNLLAKAQAGAGAAPPASQASSPPFAAAAKPGNPRGDEREKQQRHGGQAVDRS